MANVGLGEVEIVPDDGNERRRSERGEEASEEGDPRQMKRQHVRSGQAVHFANHGLVLGIHRELELGRHHWQLEHSPTSIQNDLQRFNMWIPHCLQICTLDQSRLHNNH